MSKKKLPLDFDERKDYFVIPIEKDKQLKWEEVFSNTNPVHVEIGSGKGEFISQKPLLVEGVNFLGIELKQKRIVTILKKLRPTIHPHVRLAELKVDKEVENILPAESIQTIYIQHPDPWPKRKHHRYRLIQHELIDVLYKLLIPGGTLEISTDHHDYAMWIHGIMVKHPEFVPFTEQGYSRVYPEGHITTYFEQVKCEKGETPYFLFYTKEAKDEERA